jgi:fibronectin-binding autotransporter adhesin
VLRNMGSGALVWNGNAVNNMTANGADLSLSGTGAGVAEFAGLITNNGANTLRLIKTEVGTWKVSGANTFTGLMDIFNGTLQATTIANNGTASSIGAGTTIRFGGFAGETGVLEYVGSGSTNNKQFKLGGGGTANTGGSILNNGTGALVFNNATFNAAGDGTFSGTTRALTLGGTNAADNTISGIIANNGGSSNVVSVVKTGTGKWILSGANTYTGDTTVSEGTLVVVRSNVAAAITSNSLTIAFSNAPAVGTYAILPGALGPSSLGSVAVTGLGGKTATVTNTPNLAVQVAKTTPTLSNLSATAITYGQTLSNSVISGTAQEGTNSVAGTFSFSDPSATPAAGTNSQNVTFTPTDGSTYNTATSTVSVTVDKATPTITTAPTASAITEGQSLSASLLSGGEGSVPGSFAWTDDSTVLMASGNYEVTFTPADANYATITTMVSVTVTPSTPPGSSFTGWRGTNPASTDLLQQYAYGAATPADQASRSNLPAVSLTNGNLVLTYFVRREATNTDLVVPQLSTNLGSSTNWGALPASNIATVGTNNVNGVEVVKKTATVPVDAASRKFLRLKIQE